MAQEFWYSITDAIHDAPFDGWTNQGGANKNASTRIGGGRTGPATHDEDTTYMTAATVVHQALNVDWPGPIGVWSGVLTAGVRHRTGATNEHRQAYMMNAAGTSGGTAFMDVTDLVATYATVGPIDISVGATYRPLGGAWTADDFVNDKTTFSDVSRVSGTGTVFVTSVWGEISYIPPVGGFAFLLGLAGLMSLQLAGPMTDYTQFEKFLQWRHDVHPRHTILTTDEKVTAWDEYKSYTHPRFFYG